MPMLMLRFQPLAALARSLFGCPSPACRMLCNPQQKQRVYETRGCEGHPLFSPHHPPHLLPFVTGKLQANFHFHVV